MADRSDDEALTERCSNCAKKITESEWIKNRTLCDVCFDEDYQRYLNSQRNRAERGRPGRRPPPRRK